MNKVPLQVLLVEDNPRDARMLQIFVEAVQGATPLVFAHVETMADAAIALQGQRFDVILLDLSLPDSLGLDTVSRMHKVAPSLPIVVLTGVDDEGLAMRAVRRGAQDYLIKGEVDGKMITRAILHSVERKRVEEELKCLNETLEERVAERTAVAERRARQLSELAAQASQAEQRERRRLAQVLHDGLQQLLVAAKFQTSQLQRQFPYPEVADAVAQLDSLLDQSIQASRELTVELSPPVLYEAGLVPALQWLARQMYDKHRLCVDIQAFTDVNPCEELNVLLFQSVRELLFNVVKHAGVDQASVSVLPHEDDTIKIVVQDNGKGFNPDTSIHGIPGGGFGLFSIHERLELLGGRMHINSRPNGGTSLILYAPVNSHKLRFPQEPAPALSPMNGRKLRVLLADDHNILCRGLHLVLQQQRDFEVVGHALDGQAAVELAREMQPDVILMDVNMPKLNGVEATRLITRELSDICVIGLSMHEESEMAAAMCEAGARAYLMKGTAADVLLETIRRCCAQVVAA